MCVFLCVFYARFSTLNLYARLYSERYLLCFKGQGEVKPDAMDIVSSPAKSEDVVPVKMEG